MSETWGIRKQRGAGILVDIVSDESKWFIAERILPKHANKIVAAPEMLEALELAESIISKVSVTELKRFIGEGLLLGDAAETIRSAIKKAKGE